MLERSITALADSIRARILIGGLCASDNIEELGCCDDSVCRITSVMKCKSEAELTLGTTIVSRFGALSYEA